ncbi:MAG: hypothetical protein NTNFB02_28290 [Nitrospira sp.]
MDEHDRLLMARIRRTHILGLWSLRRKLPTSNQEKGQGQETVAGTVSQPSMRSVEVLDEFIDQREHQEFDFVDIFDV